MISFNHSTDEKQRVTPQLEPPQPHRERHGGENVTSSAAIAPGCLSARWEGGGRGET